MKIRRVVTGHDANGKSVLVSDEQIEPITIQLAPGWEFFRLWGADSPRRFPGDGSPPPAHTYFPPVRGFRFGAFRLEPDSVAVVEDLDMEAAVVEAEQKLPGAAEYLESEHPGMHTTATIDYEFIVSGRCVLELDDGATCELGPGDTVIQNGTRHAWRNPYDEPCVVVFALLGAQHDNIPKS